MPEHYFVLACPTIHENGEKCGGFMVAEGDIPGSELLVIFATRELAELAVSDVSHGPAPDVVEISVSRV